jgi:hypothetical protein
LKNINSIKTTANPGERFISGRRGGRKSAGPTRTTSSTRQQDSSTLPCRQGLTLLTIPSLDCSSVWLLILMMLLFLPYLSLPYGISHRITTPYLLASYISLPHVSKRNIFAWSTLSRGNHNFSSQAYFLRIWGCEGGICNPLLGQWPWEGAEREGVVKDWLVGSMYQGRGRTSGFYTDSTIPSGIVCSSCRSRGGCRLGSGGSSYGLGSIGRGRLRTEAGNLITLVESNHAAAIESDQAAEADSDPSRVATAVESDRVAAVNSDLVAASNSDQAAAALDSDLVAAVDSVRSARVRWRR